MYIREGQTALSDYYSHFIKVEKYQRYEEEKTDQADYRVSDLSQRCEKKFISFFRPQQLTVDQDQPNDCWSHVHLFAERGKPSSNQFRSDIWSACRGPGRGWLSRSELRYKWVANQINHDGRLAMVPYTG